MIYLKFNIKRKKLKEVIFLTYFYIIFTLLNNEYAYNPFTENYNPMYCEFPIRLQAKAILNYKEMLNEKKLHPDT